MMIKVLFFMVFPTLVFASSKTVEVGLAGLYSTSIHSSDINVNENGLNSIITTGNMGTTLNFSMGEVYAWETGASFSYGSSGGVKNNFYNLRAGGRLNSEHIDLGAGLHFTNVIYEDDDKNIDYSVTQSGLYLRSLLKVSKRFGFVYEYFSSNQDDSFSVKSLGLMYHAKIGK
jgi:hypothetical protein